MKVEDIIRTNLDKATLYQLTDSDMEAMTQAIARDLSHKVKPLAIATIRKREDEEK